jgi:DNA gyrase/topoisomerase IV subunit A
MERKRKVGKVAKSNDSIIELPISKFIDTKFRDYSIYTITSRGIPNFYDALTPVQRFILKSTNTTFDKTLTVVGKSIAAGYHHGNSSLEKAIAKLARPFSNSNRILEGYGFFGSEVTPEPAAARYTSVKLSASTANLIKEYDHLNTKEPEGEWDPFWMNIPLGLTSTIVGIAVGYKSTILPRKIEDIKKFLNGKIKKVKPSFKDFNGEIKKYNKEDNTWIISSVIEIEDRRIKIREIPPILKYSSAIKKLDFLFNKYEGQIRVINNSNNKVSIDVLYTGKSKNDFEDIKNFLYRTFSIIVKESIVFVKDEQVLVYDCIEDYLEDYKWVIKRLEYFHTKYQKNILINELTFNEAKEKFIQFILQKRRSNSEIDAFIKSNKWENNTAERLERMTSRKFTRDELAFTRSEIKRYTAELKAKTREFAKIEKEYKKLKDPTLKRGISSKTNVVNLFNTDDIEIIDGISVWNSTDILEEPENTPAELVKI